ncbi:MAG: hypothetical protein AB8B66_02795 [Rickettsiaceae bacterium]
MNKNYKLLVGAYKGNGIILRSAFFLFMIFIPMYSCVAGVDEISDIFIEATGNNQYEAKIKANKHGMFRSLRLLANKANLNTDTLQHIPYSRLKQAFKPVDIRNEVSLSDRYSATVNYIYNKNNIYQLLLEFGDSAIDDQFYDILVLPVFKQSNILNIWDAEPRWNDVWRAASTMLNRYKILYPKTNLLYAEKINATNLFNLKYDDFLEVFDKLLFKNVVVITSEFFTDRRTFDGLMKIKKYIFTSYASEPLIIEEEYDITSLEDVPYIVQLVIDKFISDYGSITTLSQIQENPIQENVNLLAEKMHNEPIIMNCDVISELQTIKDKLSRIKRIDHFLIQHEYKMHYTVLIYTSSNLQDLSEALYLHRLSYNVHDDVYNLINVERGG